MIKLNGASISDIHVGHKKVTADVMHMSLKKSLYPRLMTGELDVLYIGGDFFDTLLDMNGLAGYHAAAIIRELIDLAWEYKFFIRVLRGTFSHDRLQNQFFLLADASEMVDNNAKASEPRMLKGDPLVRYFDSITIEYMKTYDIHVLYVPDDLPYEDATPVIKKIIAEHQLDKVDIAVVHSYFRHLLPHGMPHVPNNTYDAEVFSDMVKGVVLNGHVHKSCVFHKVITNGSFERLNHGEEEAKGFFCFEYDKENEKCTHEFVENIHASIFRDINLSKYRTEREGLEAYTSWLTNLLQNDNSSCHRVHVRVISDDLILRQAIIAYTKSNYDNVLITGKSLVTYDIPEEEVITHTADLPNITEDNLPVMISDHLFKTIDVDINPAEILEVLNDTATA